MSKLNTTSTLDPLTVSLAPSFQELGLQGVIAISRVSVQQKLFCTLLCKLLDWALGRCTPRYVRTTISLSSFVNLHVKIREKAHPL